MKSLLAGFHARVAAATAIGAVVILAMFDSTQAGFFPVCPFHSATGLHCPGCGATRASHMLLDGDVSGAFGMNALFVVALGMTGAFAVVRVGSAMRARRVPSFALGDGALIAAGIVLLVFGVLRNLPFEPFIALSP
jgi:hypothetical protein